MNPLTLKMALSAASSVWGRAKDHREQKAREAYETLAEAAGSVDLDHLKGRSAELLDESHREAGALTKAARARLEKARGDLSHPDTAQAEADKAKKAFRKTRKDLRKDASRRAKAAEKKAKKAQGKKRRNTMRNFGLLALVAALIAALYYWFTRRPEPGTTPPHVQDFSDEGAATEESTATLVYSTSTPEGQQAPAGDLAEEPAERDEELLSALDEQLETHRSENLTDIPEEDTMETPDNAENVATDADANPQKTADQAAEEIERDVTEEAEETKGSGETAELGDLQAQGEELEDEFDRKIGRNPDDNQT